MTELQHPTFRRWTIHVPASRADEWRASGWIDTEPPASEPADSDSGDELDPDSGPTDTPNPEPDAGSDEPSQEDIE